MRAWPIVLGVVMFARNAAAQEVEVGSLPRDPEGGCIAIAIQDVTPATFELSPWLFGGGGFRTRDGGGLGTLGGGADGTFGIATIGSPRAFYGGPVELRAGPWIAIETPFDRVRGEGGLALTVGQVRHARWGTFGVRLGAGHDFQDRPHLVGVLTYGVRYVPGRIAEERGACDPPSPTPDFALGSGAKVFGALRRPVGTGAEQGFEMVFGVELEPTFFLPPYRLSKWIGAHHP